MNKEVQVYWNRKPGVEANYISGRCEVQNVPSYGEVLYAPIPTEISVETDQTGTTRLISPPVICGRYAYRYRATITTETRANLPTMHEFAINSLLRVETVEAPILHSNEENWWSYVQYSFKSLEFNKKTPVRLMKKWKRNMLSIILDNHPEKDEHLRIWDERVDSHNSHVKMNSRKKLPAHKKCHGDIVVIPRPMSFKDVGIKQVFKYDIQSANTFTKRAKHSMKISGLRFTVPHGEAMTFKDGAAPIESMSCPIRIAMCLISWSRSNLSSAHSVLTAIQTFGKTYDSLMDDVDAQIKIRNDERNLHGICTDVEAAIAALSDFGAPRVHPDMHTIEAQALQQIHGKFDSTLQYLISKRDEMCGIKTAA